MTGARGLLALHAHPDDESITMGGTLARYAASCRSVTVVTATLGEHGETMYGRLDGLTAAVADQLGGYRYAELTGALRALGVSEHRMLGGLGTFRDSGMAGESGAEHPRAFIAAQHGGTRHSQAVTALTDILDATQPAVVATYDATGGYGHPDHIACHDVALTAVTAWNTRQQAAGRLEHMIRLVAVVRPRAQLAAGLTALYDGPVRAIYSRPDVDDLGTLADEAPDIAVAVGPWRAARIAALRAHATQLDVWPGRVDGFALTNMAAQPLLEREYYQVLGGPAAPSGATCLFAGLPPNVAR